MPLITTAGTASAESYGYAIAPPRENLFPVSNLLVTGNGANGANNSTFVDSSTANSGSGWPISAFGNLAQGSNSPFARAPINWSYYVASLGTVNFPAGLVTAMGTTGISGKKFTMECFILPTDLTVSSNTTIFGCYSTASVNGRWVFGYQTNASSNVQLIFLYSTSTTTTDIRVSAASTNIVFGRWNHIAITIDATTPAVSILNFFANGRLLSSSTANFATGSQNVYASTPSIGTGAEVVGIPFVGYISSFRLSYNAILYTGNYTVPTAPLPALASTILLTCQNNYMKDNSVNNFAVTNNAVVAPSTISPSTYNYPYSSTLVSGSISFDGAGDYISVPDNAALELGTSNFCFECLFSSTTTTGTGSILQKRNGAGVSPIIIWRFGTAIRVYMAATTQGSIVNDVSLGTISINQWYHVAVYRVGTAIYGSLNGVITTLNANTSLSVLNNTTPYTIGMNGDGTTDPFSGKMSNVRLVIGSSVYTSTSVPRPTEPLRDITDTKLLLLGSNANVVDSTTNLGIELFNTTVSTTQSKYGVGSLSFNGTSSYVRIIPFSTNFNSLLMVSGNVTAEVFVYPTSFATAQAILFLNGNTGGFAGIRLDTTVTTGVPVAYISTTGGAWAATLTSSTALTLNTWSHLAVVRNGGTFTLYLDGTSVASSTAISAETNLPTGLVSYLGAASPTASFYSGYMYGVRVSYGARYTANFTPPTGPYPLLGP